MEESVKRKGACCAKKIPPDVLEALTLGKMESASLTEVLAIDLSSLLQETFPSLPLRSIQHVKESFHLGWMKRVKLVTTILYEAYGEKVLDQLMAHPSDTVRGWAAGVMGILPTLSLKERLSLVKPLAQDAHFGVREMAWLFLREVMAQDIVESVTLLEPWVYEESSYLRRFATESTRPRGVWCSHIPLLKENPSLGLPLLHPLSQDPVKYVQDSVANWLNDAGKTQKAFVLHLTQAWLERHPNKATVYICKRATRNLLT